MANTEATKPKVGRRHVVGVGDRLTRSQIAIRAKIDRETVTKYLGMEGAPNPDEKMRFSYKAAMAWIQRQAPRVASNSDEMRKIRESLLRLELEEAEHEMKVKRGQYIDRSRIAGVFATINSMLTASMQDIFEKELPVKYKGRTDIERAELNAAGVDRVLRQLKENMDRLGKIA